LKTIKSEKRKEKQKIKSFKSFFFFYHLSHLSHFFIFNFNFIYFIIFLYQNKISKPPYIDWKGFGIEMSQKTKKNHKNQLLKKKSKQKQKEKNFLEPQWIPLSPLALLFIFLHRLSLTFEVLLGSFILIPEDFFFFLCPCPFFLLLVIIYKRCPTFLFLYNVSNIKTSASNPTIKHFLKKNKL